MASEKYIKAIIYVAVLVWTVVLYVNHEAVHSAWLQPLSTVITVVLWAVMAFDLWLWKLSVLHGWFVKRPVIDGVWKARINSNWQNPATGTGIPPVEAYMVVRQTFSTLSMRLLTAESSSELVGTEIVCSADGFHCVSGVYRNEPRFQVRDRSAIHYGAVWLKIIEQPNKEILGHYWTDRQTAGEITLTARRNEKFQTFQSAQAYFNQTLIPPAAVTP
jgi:predicted pore-forming effector associated with SMODS systems